MRKNSYFHFILVFTGFCLFSLFLSSYLFSHYNLPWYLCLFLFIFLTLFPCLLLQAIHQKNVLLQENQDLKQKLSQQKQTLWNQYQKNKMRAIRRLGGRMAHEFNNLLTLILGFGYELKESLPPDPLLQDDTTEIIRAGERGAEITNQLLSFSQSQTTPLTSTHLNWALLKMEPHLRSTLPSSIHLSYHLDNRLSPILASTAELESLILALLSNAIDALTTKEKILQTISLETILEMNPDSEKLNSSYFACLKITDPGTGMSNDELEKAFEPFFTTKEKRKGLGLTTAYHSVQHMNGDITLSSSPNTGTTITIRFPLIEKPLDIPYHPYDFSESPLSQTKTILVVEDDESIRTLTLKTLQALGHTIIEASDGEKGLQQIMDHHTSLDLIICDVLMPKQTGFEMLEKLKEKNISVPLLFISGLDKDQPDISVPSESFFLCKPFTRKQLLYKVQETLTRHVLKEL